MDVKSAFNGVLGKRLIHGLAGLAELSHLMSVIFSF